MGGGGRLKVSEKGGVCTIEINRPEKMNTLNTGAIGDLMEVLDRLERREEVRVLVIRGAGEKAFCAGFDISELPAGNGGHNAGREQYILEGTFARVRNFRCPVIAMINGACVGAGLDLAVNCDFRLAAGGARLGITPAKLGVAYHPAGLNRFIRLVGVAAAKYLFYTGRLVSAGRALEMGLVDLVATAGGLEEEVDALAGEIAGNAPLSVAASKYTIDRLAEKYLLTPGEEETVRRMIVSAFNSQDLAEGKAAFLEKRKPLFRGR